MKEEVKKEVSQRVDFVLSDAKTYIFVRQKDYHRTEKIGGGNFATAHSLLSLINLLSKIHYFLHSPQKFVTEDESSDTKTLIKELRVNLPSEKKRILGRLPLPKPMMTNETDAFVAFAKELELTGIPLSPSSIAETDLRVIWSGFRNMLAHISTVQSGKGIATYELSESKMIKKSWTLERILIDFKSKSRSSPPFHYDSTRPGWIFNVDAMVSLLKNMDNMTAGCIDKTTLGETDLKKLKSLIIPK